jgi:DNA polymerase III delta subunit
MKALLQGDPEAAQQLVQGAMQNDEASAKLIQDILKAE